MSDDKPKGGGSTESTAHADLLRRLDPHLSHLAGCAALCVECGGDRGNGRHRESWVPGSGVFWHDFTPKARCTCGRDEALAAIAQMAQDLERLQRMGETAQAKREQAEAQLREAQQQLNEVRTDKAFHALMTTDERVADLQEQLREAEARVQRMEATLQTVAASFNEADNPQGPIDPKSGTPLDLTEHVNRMGRLREAAKQAVVDALANSEVKAARAPLLALVNYAQHKRDCTSRESIGISTFTSQIARPCSCGLAELEAALRR